MQHVLQKVYKDQPYIWNWRNRPSAGVEPEQHAGVLLHASHHHRIWPPHSLRPKWVEKLKEKDLSTSRRHPDGQHGVWVRCLAPGRPPGRPAGQLGLLNGRHHRPLLEERSRESCFWEGGGLLAFGPAGLWSRCEPSPSLRPPLLLLLGRSCLLCLSAWVVSAHRPLLRPLLSLHRRLRRRRPSGLNRLPHGGRLRLTWHGPLLLVAGEKRLLLGRNWPNTFKWLLQTAAMEKIQTLLDNFLRRLAPNENQDVQLSNGGASNGIVSNGHSSNGYASNGHGSNGLAQSQMTLGHKVADANKKDVWLLPCYHLVVSLVRLDLVFSVIELVCVAVSIDK